MAFFKIFKDKTIVKRLFFTIFVISLYELGTIIPVPYVNTSLVAQKLNNLPALQVLGLAGGGAFKRFSLLALGISPFITSQILIQMLQMDIVPRLSEWSKEGEQGRRKTTRVTRLVTLVVAMVQGFGFSFGIEAFAGQSIYAGQSGIGMHILIALYFTFGTVIALWFADLISDKGLGNGSSILISIGIVGSIPGVIISTVSNFAKETGKLLSHDVIQFIVSIIVIAILLFISVYVYLAERKVPIRYANKQSISTVSSKSNLPIKVNIAGVVPVIFAFALLTTPHSIAGFFHNSFANTVNLITDTSKPIGMIISTVLIIGFSYFYVLIQINPKKIAENINKNNGFIPRVRPGKETEKYIKSVMMRLTFYGSIFLAILSLLPSIAEGVFHLPSTFRIGGTGILIIIGVAIETWKKIDAKVNTKSYDIFKYENVK